MRERCLTLFAQVPAWDWNVVVYSGLLAVALLVGAGLIALAGKWRRASAHRKELLSPSEQLAQFRSLYEQGGLSREEFDRLRGLLGQQMRQALDLPAGPAAPGPVVPGQPAPTVGSPANVPGDGRPPQDQPPPPPDDTAPA